MRPRSQAAEQSKWSVRPRSSPSPGSSPSSSPIGVCGPVLRPSSNPSDHDGDAGEGVRQLLWSERLKQAFRAPKQKPGRWADFGGLWYYTCFVSKAILLKDALICIKI